MEIIDEEKINVRISLISLIIVTRDLYVSVSGNLCRIYSHLLHKEQIICSN